MSLERAPMAESEDWRIDDAELDNLFRAWRLEHMPDAPEAEIIAAHAVWCAGRDSGLAEGAALNTLAAIESSAMKVTRLPDEPPSLSASMHPVWEAVNGFRFRVFDDCGEWDYFDAIAWPGGDWVEYEALGRVRNWHPSKATLNTVWQWAPNGRSPMGYGVATPKEPR